MGTNYLLFDPVQNKVIKTGEAEAISPTRFSLRLSPEETSAMPRGIYHLFLLTHSDKVSLLAERRIDIGVGVEKPPITQATPKITETPKKGVSLTLIIIPVVIVVAAIMAFLVLRRVRARKTP